MANSYPGSNHHHDYRPSGSGFALCGYDPARELVFRAASVECLRPGEPEFEQVREQIEIAQLLGTEQVHPSIVSR